jgi:low affinity Fe/Cu permease
MNRKGWMERIALVATHWSGSTAAFILAMTVVLLWLFTGPLFKFSDTWQLVINTGTTIVTFLMVFLIQRSQNKEAVALQLKLNELVAAIEGASNRLINIEDLSEAEIATLHKHYNTLSRLAAHDDNLTHSHSIEEAEERHAHKHRGDRKP